MNHLLCVFIFVGSFIPIFGSNEDGFTKDINEYRIRDKINEYGLNYNYTQRLGRKGSYKFDFDDGNPDVHGNIERPCQVYDTFCIRKFFAEHSTCKISGRRLPDPFYRAQDTTNYPSANMSATVDNFVYEGLNNARVEEFYIDTVTDNLVIAIAFDAIKFAGDNTNFKFYLRGREPEVHRIFATLVYEKITVTLVIPGLNDLKLDRAEITTYANSPILPFAASPNFFISANPEVVAMATYFVTAGVPTENLEQLYTDGVFFGGNYLQYNICDFGIKIL